MDAAPINTMTLGATEGSAMQAELVNALKAQRSGKSVRKPRPAPAVRGRAKASMVAPPPPQALMGALSAEGLDIIAFEIVTGDKFTYNEVYTVEVVDDHFEEALRADIRAIEAKMHKIVHSAMHLDHQYKLKVEAIRPEGDAHAAHAAVDVPDGSHASATGSVASENGDAVGGKGMKRVPSVPGTASPHNLRLSMHFSEDPEYYGQLVSQMVQTSMRHSREPLGPGAEGGGAGAARGGRPRRGSGLLAGLGLAPRRNSESDAKGGGGAGAGAETPDRA